VSNAATIASTPTADPDLRFRGKCEGGAGPNLSRYPSLTYAPSQWGDGVRTHGVGADIVTVAEAASKAGLVASLDAFAVEHGLDLGELLNAIEYARALKVV
jgi:hypothetical protein